MIISFEELQDWCLTNGCSGKTAEEVYQEWLVSHYKKCEDQYQ